MAEHPPGFTESDLGAVLELRDAAEVMYQRRCDQQIAVEPQMQLAGLEGQCPDGNSVLEEATQVGVMATARAGRTAPLAAKRRVCEQGVEQPAVVGVVNLSREM